ncbi:GSCFA domain-containing protein [Methylobacterium sp. WSM2598]|uniref:GSCFA domain-containing protein n=1 Tax=Methylobacterium sp. WSM2598 TaxID=398261 RepID=UPI00036675C6|nr:GSCFA domain-containing protein [Methylobacterium sp. WSM2598]
MTHPYRTAPDHSFWHRAVVEVDNVDPVVAPSFTIDRFSRVATAGSCFAQHIARYLQDVGIPRYTTEECHPEVGAYATDFHYHQYTARYGNVYTARQLYQLFLRAHGQFAPLESAWPTERGFADPFRPGIPEGFASRRELERDVAKHLAAVRRMFEELDVLIFTLGLTESWVSLLDGSVFPSCPGTIAGTFEPAKYRFHNFTMREVVDDLTGFIAALRSVNKRAKVLLTVSPVPLVATANGGHVLTATTYSKSVLRVAAEEVAAAHAEVDYFPSYEIIMGPQARGRFFAQDLRTVTEEGVATVMNLFRRHYLGSMHSFRSPVPAAALSRPLPSPSAASPAAAPGDTEAARRQLELICEEMANDDRARA